MVPPLLSEVHNCIGPVFLEQRKQAVVMLADSKIEKVYMMTRYFVPCLQAFSDGSDRREGLYFQLYVDLTT